MYDNLSVERSSTVDRAVDELRRALFAGEIAPGTPLREVALSEAMGVARSTIREALSVLVSDGMAVRVTHKGVAVRQLTDDDVRDVIRARLALEGAGMRNWPRATSDMRGEPRRALERYAAVARETLDAGAVTEAHLSIHRAFVGLAGSERLLAAFDSIASEIRLGLAHLDRVRGNAEGQIVEHTRLVEQLEDDAVDAAVDELGRHLDVAQESLLAATGHGTIKT
ncbi:MAG TPA: GntR family transcriptional regulator [Nocardioidaceae bacterium]|nr:GntR family transcriptional regulator [Nocardioidaceae bacterium]